MNQFEAYNAMKGGAKVSQVWADWTGLKQSVFYFDTEGEIQRVGIGNYENAYEDFLKCKEYAILPDPDSAEKFVRDFNADCPHGPLPDYWTAFIDRFIDRAGALIKQMEESK